MSNEDVVNEIEEEIKKAKGQPEDFEIEITDDPKKEAVEEAKDVAEEKQAKEVSVEELKILMYGEKVQKRIKKLVDQRREAEIQARQMQDQNDQLSKRLRTARARLCKKQRASIQSTLCTNKSCIDQSC
jgi:uncharacterized protein (DUF3084 family)